MTLRVYGADWCRDCIRTKSQLEQLKIPFDYLDVAADGELAEQAKEISGRINIPVVVYPDGSHQVEPSNSEVEQKLIDLGLLGHAGRHPGEPLAKNSAALVAEANTKVELVSVERAKTLLADPNWLFVDLRDPRELAKAGTIPGAYRAPRGMLEFWIDPESPYYRAALDDGRRLLLYCGSGWRSALAAVALKEMGREDIAHLEGGFTAWTEAEGPIEQLD